MNQINGATGYGIYVTNSNEKNNTFVNNEIQNVKVGIVISNNTDSMFLKNYIGPVQQVEYIVADNSSLKLKSTLFSSDKLRSLDGNNSISISDSGVVDTLISVDKNKTSFDTNKSIYTFQLPDRATATLTSIG